MDPILEELAEKLRASGHNQYTLKRAGIGAATIRRLLGLEPGGVNLNTVRAAAELIGYTIKLERTGSPVLMPKDAPPTGSSKPGSTAKTSAMRSTDEAPAGSGPLTRKRKTAAATFLPGELEPVTTGAVTKKRKRTMN
jgi:hypothetical protein